MEPSTMINIFLAMILLITLVIITARLFIRLRATKLNNLLWLIIFFIGQSILGFFQMADFQFGFYVTEIISFIALVFFTNETFHKNQRSSFILVLLILITLSSGILTFVILRLLAPTQGLRDLYYLLHTYFFTLAIFLTSFWYSSASFSALNLIRDEKIDDAIKLRYKVLGLSAIIFALQGFITPMHVFLQIHYPTEIMVRLYTIMNVGLLLIFALGNLYAWVILGRKIEESKETTPSVDEISEEDMMKMIKETK